MTAWGGATSAMNAMTATSAAAHTVHYALVVGGIVAIAGVLGARLVPSDHRPPDPHDLRVAVLRRAATTGTLGVRPVPATTAPPRTTSTGPATALWPLALVASAAAAGVHAAMAPAHLREQTVLGLFFAAAALAQLAWTALALGTRPRRGLLVAGAVGNTALVALWALTRTVGLPLGLLPAPEAVGAWDLAALVWELVVVGACLALLRDAYAGRRTTRVGWHPAATVFLGASVTALALLSLSGAGG